MLLLRGRASVQNNEMTGQADFYNDKSGEMREGEQGEEKERHVSRDAF